MPSKGVIDRQRVAQDVLQAARTHSQQVGEALAAQLGGFVAEGEPTPDFVAFQLLLARYLEDRLTRLVAADEIHLVELDDDQAPRLRRDEAVAQLHVSLVRIRDVIKAAYGTVLGTNLLGIDGATSNDPLTLHRQASRALDRLREPKMELPAVQLGGVDVDLQGLADELQPATAELTAALREVRHEQRQREATLKLKNEAMGEVDAAIGGVGRVLIGCDEIAGFPSFAARIRLTLPARRARTNGEPETTEPEETTPDAPSTQGAEPGSEPGSSSGPEP